MTRARYDPRTALDAEIARRRTRDNARNLASLFNDPVTYAREILGMTYTPDQEKIAISLFEPPYRTYVKSAHSVGKTALAASLINHHFDTVNPGVTWSTAPTKESLVDGLWAEVRLQRRRAGLPDYFIGPAAPEMRTAPDHLAKGLTATVGGAFSGKHRENQFFVFDEAEDVAAMYWIITNTMFQPDGTNRWLVILNPITTSSQAYIEESLTGPDGRPKWTVFTLSALEHPNVTLGLSNRCQIRNGGTPEPISIPTAVTLEQVESWIAEWFEPVEEPDHDIDIEWPPGSGKWLRPDPAGESRVLGRRPTGGTWGVWTERAFDLCCAAQLTWAPTDLPELGADIGREGPDKTEIHSRIGPCSLAHEAHGGWDTVKSATRLMELADSLALWKTKVNPPQQAPHTGRDIPIKVDDAGVGGGVVDVLRANRYFVVPVNAGSRAAFPDKYKRLRDELWFAARALAKARKLDFSRLSQKTQQLLKMQALAPIWAFTPARQREVEAKEDTRKRLKRSPDSMDAVNLAYYTVGTGAVRPVETPVPPPPFTHGQTETGWAAKRKLFGMG